MANTNIYLDFVADGAGTVNAITATYSPAVPSLYDGLLLFFFASGANTTTTPTFNPNGLGAKTIVKKGGTALAAGDIPGTNALMCVAYDLGNTRWELLNPAAASVTGTADHILYFDNAGSITGDANATRDAITNYTKLKATIALGITGEFSLGADLFDLALNIPGVGICYKKTATKIFGLKAANDTIVGGTEIATIFYTDLGGNQDNFFQVTETTCEAGVTDDGVSYVGASLSDPEGFITTGKDNGAVNNSFVAKSQNATNLLLVRNDGVVTAPFSMVVGGNATAQGKISLKEDSDNGTDSVTIQPPASLAASYTITLPADDGTAANQYLKTDGSGVTSWVTVNETVAIACSDLTTALTTGTYKGYITLPFAFTVTGVSASVLTAPTGASLLTVDINESNVTILSTKLTFDATELTTSTAATPAVISDSTIAAYAPISCDIDVIGSTIAGAGLIVYLDGYRT